MAIAVTPEDVDEMPQQTTPSTPENSTIVPTDPSDPGINTTPRPPAAITADDVDSLPPGLMKRPDPSQTMAVADPDSADAYANILHNRGSAKSQEELAKPKPSVIDMIRQKHPDFGKRVSVNGVEGTVIGRHPKSGKYVVHWDK